MSLTIETLYAGPAFHVRVVRCQPEHGGCGPDEVVAVPQMAFPLRGVFLMHPGSRERVVADPCHALFFSPQQPYRVSHPVHGGDECLVLEPAREVLAEISSALDPNATEGNPPAFRWTGAPLDAGQIAARRLLHHGLAHRMADALAVEETALGLFARAFRANAAPEQPRRVPQRRAHHAAMVEAVKIALASRPTESWTLAALAKLVHSSPFHLARLFRARAGMPVHQYHLLARMTVALDQVLDTARDFTTIGIELGFSSHSHFTATFRRTFGVIPSDLRRNATTRTARALRARS